MNTIYAENNNAVVVGTMASELQFSHEVYGEKFFFFKLSIPRLSDTADIIVITISERFFPQLDLTIGKHFMIKGQFRSYNNFSNIGNKLILTIFVKEIKEVEDANACPNPNSIFLNGYICKPPIYRTTPFGREIADILLAVNRSYNKSDYIPCIAWGRNAKFSQCLEIGSKLKVWGRIQSREYQKKVDEETVETKTAYEISVSKLEIDTDSDLSSTDDK